MNRLTSLLIVLATALFSNQSQAKLNVLTSIPDLKSITEEVGKDFVTVDNIAKGTQDPHYIEAKPSFMVKANRADLFIAIGLDLEIGWLPSILQGARNPKIQRGQKGYLEVGSEVNPLEIPSGTVSRAEGDVHPLGNPHIWLDPIRCSAIAQLIAKRLGELDPDHRVDFDRNAKSFQNRIEIKTKDWMNRIQQSGIKRIVTYHKTLTYFFDRFRIENPAILEPKPGIPPTSGHILEVIQIIKQDHIPLILVENYFDPTVTQKITQEVKSIRVETIPVSVEGAENVHSIEDLIERIVKAIEKGLLR